MMQPAPAFDLRHAFERQKAASAFLGPPPSLNMPAGPDFPHLPSRNRSPSPVFQTRIVQRAQQQPGSADLHSSSIVVQGGPSAASSSTRSGSATAVHQQVVRQHYHSTRPGGPLNITTTSTSPNVTTRDFRYVVPVDSGTTSKTSQSSSIISSGVSLSHLSSQLSGGQHPHQSQTMVRLQKWQEVDRTREEIERQRKNYELLLQQAGSSTYPPPNATPGSSGADAGFPRPLLPQIEEEDEGIQRLHSLSHNVRAPPTAAGAPGGDRQHVRVVNLATPLEVEQPSDQQILAAYTTPVDAYGRAVGSGSNSQNVHSDQISFSAKSCTTFANSPTAAQQMVESYTGGHAEPPGDAQRLKNSTLSTPGGLLYGNHPSYQQQLLLSSDASSASCSWKEKRPEKGILDSPSNGAGRDRAVLVRGSVRKNFETGKVEALGSSSQPPHQPPEVLMQEKVAELQERGARLRELVAEVAEEERVAAHHLVAGKVEDTRGPGGAPEASTASVASGSGGHPQPLFYSSAGDAAAAPSQEDQGKGRPRALSTTTSNKGDSTAKSAAASASSVATKTSNLFQPKSRASTNASFEKQNDTSSRKMTRDEDPNLKRRAARPHYATPTESAKKRIQQSHQQPASELLEQRSGLELNTKPRQYAYRNRTTKKAASGRMSSARVLSGTARLTDRDEAMYEYLHSKLTTSAALHRQSSLDKRREMESRSVNDGSPSQEARIPDRARREYVDSDGFPSALRDGSPSRIQSFPASSHFLDRPGDAALKHVSAQARGRRPITNDTTLEFLKRCGIEGFQDSFRAKMHLEKYDQQLKESVSVEEAKTGPIGGSASLVVKKAPSPPSENGGYYVHMQKKDYAISERLHDLAKPQGSGHHDGAFAGAADAVGLGGGDDAGGGKPLPGGVDPKNFLRRSQSSAAVGARGSGGGIGETRTEESLRKTAAAADYNSHTSVPAPLPVSPGGTTTRGRETAARPSGGTRAPTRSQSAANLMKPGQEEEQALRSYMMKIDQLNAEYAPVLEKVASVANILEKSDINLGAGAGAGGGGKNINLTMNKAGARTSSISGRSSATSSHNPQGQATAGAGALTVTELAKRSSFARSRTSPGLERPSHQGPHQPREGLSTNKPDSKKSFRGSVTSDLIVEAGGTADDFANMNDEAEFRNRAKPASTSSRKSREAVQRQARLIGKIMAARNNRAQSPGSGAARSASPIAIVHNMPSGSAKGVISPGDARNIMLFDEVDRRFVYEKTGAAGGANKGGVRFQELQKAHKALMEKGAQALARAPSPQMAVMVAKQRAEGILRSTSPRPARQGLSTTAKKVSTYHGKQAELRDDLLLVRGNGGDIRDFYNGVSVQAGLRAPQATGSSGVVIVADPRTVGATTAQTPVEQGEGKPKKARTTPAMSSGADGKLLHFSSEKKQKFPIRTGAPAGFAQAQGRRALQSARERGKEEKFSNSRTRGKPKKNSEVWRQVLHEVAASSPAPRASGAVDDHAGGAAASTTAAFDYPRSSRETQPSAPSQAQHDDDDKNLNEQIDSVLARAQKLTGGGGGTRSVSVSLLEKEKVTPAPAAQSAEKSLRIDMESPAPRAAASAGGREDANVVRNTADSTKKFMFNPELPYATPDLPSSGVNLSHDDSHLFATAPQTRKDSEEVFHTPGPAHHGSGRFGPDPGCSGPGGVLAPAAAAPEPTTTSTASSATKEPKLPQTNRDAVLFNVNNYYVSTENVPRPPPPTFSKISSRAEMTQTETDTSDTTSDAGAATAAASKSKSKSMAQRYSLATPAQNRSKEDLSYIDGRPPVESASVTESPTRKWYCAPNESEEKLLLQSRRKQGPQVVGEADFFVPRLVPQPYLIHTNQNADSCDLPVVSWVVGEEWLGEKKIGFDKPKCGAASGGFRAVGGISARDDRDAAAKRSRSPSRSPAVARNKSSPNRAQAQPGGHQSPSRQLLFSPKAVARSP